MCNNPQTHHFPPASLIALSKARLLGVRRSPVLRCSSGLPSSARRAATRAPNSAILMAGRSVSAFDVFDAIVAHAFLANTAFQIVHFRIGVKRQQQTGPELR